MRPGCTRKSANIFGALFFALILNATECMAEGQQSATFAAEIGVSALRFDYAEYQDNGTLLDRELGGIPGVSLRFTQRISQWEWEEDASYHFGRVDYTGQTNTGVPYNTRTDEEVMDAAVRVGRWIGGWAMPYAGLGYRRWDRDILPGSINGLFESYRWKYAWLGAKFITLPREAMALALDIGWIKPIDPVLYVDFRGTYSVEPRLKPESLDGLRLMLTARMALPEKTVLVLEPYFEYWRLGRSPVVSAGGVSVYEPASKTRDIGLNLRVGWEFQ